MLWRTYAGRSMQRTAQRTAQQAAAQLAVLRQIVERRREALVDLDAQLVTMPTGPAKHAESLP